MTAVVVHRAIVTTVVVTGSSWVTRMCLLLSIDRAIGTDRGARRHVHRAFGSSRRVHGARWWSIRGGMEQAVDWDVGKRRAGSRTETFCGGRQRLLLIWFRASGWMALGGIGGDSWSSVCEGETVVFDVVLLAIGFWALLLHCVRRGGKERESGMGKKSWCLRGHGSYLCLSPSPIPRQPYTPPVSPVSL